MRFLLTIAFKEIMNFNELIYHFTVITHNKDVSRTKVLDQLLTLRRVSYFHVKLSSVTDFFSFLFQNIEKITGYSIFRPSLSVDHFSNAIVLILILSHFFMVGIFLTLSNKLNLPLDKIITKIFWPQKRMLLPSLQIN